MRTVRFLKGTDAGRSHYCAGEVAGFADDVAARLVKAGAAAYADGAPTSEAAPKADTAPLPPPTSETGAASTSSLLSPETPPDPKQEAADIQAANLSRPNRRNRR